MRDMVHRTPGMVGANERSPVPPTSFRESPRWDCRTPAELSVGLAPERHAALQQRFPKLLDRFGSHAMKTTDLGLAQVGELLQANDAARSQRAASRGR